MRCGPRRGGRFCVCWVGVASANGGPLAVNRSEIGFGILHGREHDFMNWLAGQPVGLLAIVAIAGLVVSGCA